MYIPIVRAPTQKEVWTFAKALAVAIAKQNPKIVTSEYRIQKRPSKRVLIDYNQNAWGRTLASVYSVRPTPFAGVSTPVSWGEVKRGIKIDDFRLDNVRARIKKKGDLWARLGPRAKGRFDLRRFL